MQKQEKRVNIYQTKTNPIKGRSNQVVVKEARRYHKKWVKECSGQKAKRRPAVRSRTLKTAKGQKRKIFIDVFQPHLKEKNITDVARRLKLLACVRDLLENSDVRPRKRGKDHEFTGITPAGETFTVIVREKGSRLELLTFYPARPPYL